MRSLEGILPNLSALVLLLQEYAAVVKGVKEVYTRVNSTISGAEIKFTLDHSLIDTYKNSTAINVMLPGKCNQAAEANILGRIFLSNGMGA